MVSLSTVSVIVFGLILHLLGHIFSIIPPQSDAPLIVGSLSGLFKASLMLTSALADCSLISVMTLVCVSLCLLPAFSPK